ncbi:MAG: cytochrome B [Erysipelotrichaceae bacterium]
MKIRTLTRIAIMGSILFTIFYSFSFILYLELITFTILIFSLVFKKDTILACIIFALINMLVNGFTPWNIMYMLIYPSYACILSYSSCILIKHMKVVPLICGTLSFATGMLVDLGFILFSPTVTLFYVIMGLKTSIIQGCLSAILCLFLFEPVYNSLMKIRKVHNL